MPHDFEHFGYDDACGARDKIASRLRERGLDPQDIKDGIILGSGLGGFTQTYLNRDRADHNDGPVVIPFGEIFQRLEIPGGGSCCRRTCARTRHWSV